MGMNIGMNTWAELLSQALEDNLLNYPQSLQRASHNESKEIYIDRLRNINDPKFKNQPAKRYYRRFLRFYIEENNNEITQLDFEIQLADFYPDKFCHPLQTKSGSIILARFGCPLSYDIDCVVFVDDATKHFNPKYYCEINRQLQEIGYEITNVEGESIVDLAVVSFMNGTYQTVKGGSETIRIITSTFHFWDQSIKRSDLPVPEDYIVEVSIIDKLYAFAKFILTKMESLLGHRYYEYRRLKNNWPGGKGRFELAFQICEIFINNDSKGLLMGDWKSVWKSIFLKASQIILINQTSYQEYNKTYCKQKIKDLINQKFQVVGYDLDNDLDLGSNIEMVLLRQATIETFPHKTLKYLLDQLKRLYYEHFPFISTIRYKLDHRDFDRIKASPKMVINSAIFQEFLENPDNVSDSFYKTWVKYNGESLNNQEFFQGDLENAEILDRPGLNVIHKKFAQRTPEWFQNYALYEAGRNLGQPKIDLTTPFKNQLKKIYQLIRGCFGEMMVQDIITTHFITHEMKWIDPGIILKEDKIGSKSGSPDGIIFMEPNRLLPVEIKTILESPYESKEYLREIDLAQRQINGYKELLKTQCGIIFILWIYKDSDLDQWIYEISYRII